MRGWWKEDGCSEPIAALQGQLIYVRPPSTSAKMSLVLGFDEMFANGERLFFTTMAKGLHQQAVRPDNYRRGGGRTVEKDTAALGYVVNAGGREFFFSCLTEQEVLKMFEAVRQAHHAEWRKRAVKQQQQRADERRPRDLEAARELPAYRAAMAALLSCAEFPQDEAFQTQFRDSVEAALGKEDDNKEYKKLEASSSETVRGLLGALRDAFHEGWRRVVATRHPKCVAAVRALSQAPAVPAHFQKTVERELCKALVTADAEEFEQLLIGSSSERLPQAVRKLLSEAMLAFDAEKARLDSAAAAERRKEQARLETAKIVKKAWDQARETGPDGRAKESEATKEARRSESLTPLLMVFSTHSFSRSVAAARLHSGTPDRIIEKQRVHSLRCGWCIGCLSLLAVGQLPRLGCGGDARTSIPLVWRVLQLSNACRLSPLTTQKDIVQTMLRSQSQSQSRNRSLSRRQFPSLSRTQNRSKSP